MLPEPGGHVGAAVSAAGSRGAEASAGEQLVEEPRARMLQRSESWWQRRERREEPREEECAARCRLKPGAPGVPCGPEEPAGLGKAALQAFQGGETKEEDPAPALSSCQ